MIMLEQRSRHYWNVLVLRMEADLNIRANRDENNENATIIINALASAWLILCSQLF